MTLVDKLKQSVADDIAQGKGPIVRALQERYGLRAQGALGDVIQAVDRSLRRGPSVWEQANQARGGGSVEK